MADALVLRPVRYLDHALPIPAAVPNDSGTAREDVQALRTGVVGGCEDCPVDAFDAVHESPGIVRQGHQCEEDESVDWGQILELFIGPNGRFDRTDPRHL
jgi:hypothetical protein